MFMVISLSVWRGVCAIISQSLSQSRALYCHEIDFYDQSHIHWWTWGWVKGRGLVWCELKNEECSVIREQKVEVVLSHGNRMIFQYLCCCLRANFGIVTPYIRSTFRFTRVNQLHEPLSVSLNSSPYRREKKILSYSNRTYESHVCVKRHIIYEQSLSVAFTLSEDVRATWETTTTTTNTIERYVPCVLASAFTRNIFQAFPLFVLPPCSSIDSIGGFVRMYVCVVRIVMEVTD